MDSRRSPSTRSRLRVLRSKTIYNGKVVQLMLDRLIEPGGVTVDREVVGHAGSVVVLPHLPDGRILLVRQFRYATRKSLWELVAGGIEPGEAPLKAARRELLEETGYWAGSLRSLFNFYPSPGFLSERMHLIEAWDLSRRRAQPEADERIQARPFTHAQLRQALLTRKIEDGKTLVGLLWLLGLSKAEHKQRRART